MVIGKFAARAFGRPEKFGLQMGAALIALLLLGSIVPLRAAYLSKQDYLGAMQFVEQQRQGSEQIATAGVVTTPYQRYYGRPWPRAETRQQLDELMNGEQGTWLLYAMPASIRSSQPELWADIDGKFTLVRKFGGTLGGGDIYVSRSRDFKGADEDGR